MQLLNGKRVLDLSRWISGPHCANLLGSMGASVLKVESKRGEPTRRLEPMSDGVSLYFATYNANKRCVGLNLRDESTRTTLRELARHADVIVENFRPGVIADIGLDVDTLGEIGSSAVLVSISGFGQSGRHAHLPALNPVVESTSGLAWYLGDESGTPRVTPNYVADHLVGTYAAFQAAVALAADRGSNRPLQIDVSMTAVLTAHLGPSMTAALNGLPVTKPVGNRDAATAPGNAFRCADGRFVYVDAATDAQFAALARAAGRPSLVEEPAFAEGGARFQNAAGLEAELSDWFLAHPASEIEEILQDLSIPCAVVRSYQEAVREFGDDTSALVDIGHDSAQMQLRLPAPLTASGPPVRGDLTLLTDDAAESVLQDWLTSHEPTTSHTRSSQCA